MKKLFCTLLMLLYSMNAFAGEWIADATTGCQVWNGAPSPGESIKWSGACKNGKANGKGVLQWYLNGNPGSRYEGMFANGKKNGKGTLAFRNGGGYKGMFANDEMDGKGIYTNSNGGRYEGNFKHGMFNGKGTFYFVSGTYFVGSWRNDKKHGHGVSYQPSGFLQSAGYLEGEWEDDRKVSGEFVAYRDSSSSTTSSSSSSSYPELCAIAYRKDGKSPSYFDGICRNHPRSAEKWTCIIEQMDKGKSMFYGESYCGA